MESAEFLRYNEKKFICSRGRFMPDAVRRGYAPTDEKDFSQGSLQFLHRAQEDIFYLICRGYGLERSVNGEEFVATGIR